MNELRSDRSQSFGRQKVLEFKKVFNFFKVNQKSKKRPTRVNFTLEADEFEESDYNKKN